LVLVIARISSLIPQSVVDTGSAAERGLIDRAAKSSGKTRTDFILSAARRAAEEELLDRTIFVVTPAIYSKFLAMLDAPPQPNERLRRTMHATTPWSKA
jgi:uncharacterized protein (DUF1778 family)